MRTSDDTDKLWPAIMELQDGVGAVARDAKNVFHKRPNGDPHKYVSLPALLDHAQEALREQGLMILQFPGPITVGDAALATRVIHVPSGQWVEEIGEIKIDKVDAQKCMGAITYMRRYADEAFMQMRSFDDDGETGQGRGRNQKPAKKESAEPVGKDSTPASNDGERANPALIRELVTEYKSMGINGDEAAERIQEKFQCDIYDISKQNAESVIAAIKAAASGE